MICPRRAKLTNERPSPSKAKSAKRKPIKPPIAGCSSKSEKTMNPKPVSVRDTVEKRSIRLPIKTVLPLEKRDKIPSASPTYSDDAAETWPVRITERREKRPLYAAVFKK